MSRTSVPTASSVDRSAETPLWTSGFNGSFVTRRGGVRQRVRTGDDHRAAVADAQGALWRVREACRLFRDPASPFDPEVVEGQDPNGKTVWMFHHEAILEINEPFTDAGPFGPTDTKVDLLAVGGGAPIFVTSNVPAANGGAAGDMTEASQITLAIRDHQMTAANPQPPMSTGGVAGGRPSIFSTLAADHRLGAAAAVELLRADGGPSPGLSAISHPTVDEATTSGACAPGKGDPAPASSVIQPMQPTGPTYAYTRPFPALNPGGSTLQLRLVSTDSDAVGGGGGGLGGPGGDALVTFDDGTNIQDLANRKAIDPAGPNRAGDGGAGVELTGWGPADGGYCAGGGGSLATSGGRGPYVNAPVAPGKGGEVNGVRIGGEAGPSLMVDALDPTALGFDTATPGGALDGVWIAGYGGSWWIKESVLRAHPVLGDGNYTPGATGPGGQPLPDMTTTGYLPLFGWRGNAPNQIAWLDPGNDLSGGRFNRTGAMWTALDAEFRPIVTAANPGLTGGALNNAVYRAMAEAFYVLPHAPRFIYWYEGGQWHKAEAGSQEYDDRTGTTAHRAAYEPRPFSGSGQGAARTSPPPAGGMIAMRFTP